MTQEKMKVVLKSYSDDYTDEYLLLTEDQYRMLMWCTQFFSYNCEVIMEHDMTYTEI